MNLKHLLTKFNPFAKKEAKSPKPEPTPIEPSEPVEELPPFVKPEPKSIEKLEDKKKLKFYEQAHKFTDEQRQIVVAMIGAGLSPSEVVEQADEVYGIQLAESTVRNYATNDKWKPVIKKIREATMTDVTEVAGYYKKVRLQRHEKVYDKAMKKGKLKEAIAATVEQRKEVEGDSTNLNIMNNQFNVFSDDELEHKKKQVMERIRLMTANKEKAT